MIVTNFNLNYLRIPLQSFEKKNLNILYVSLCRTVSHCALPYSEGWWLELNWILTIFYAVIEALTFGQYLLPQGLWFEHIRTYTSWVYIRISSHFSSQIVFWTQNFKNLRDIFLCNETPISLIQINILKKIWLWSSNLVMLFGI